MSPIEAGQRGKWSKSRLPKKISAMKTQPVTPRFFWGEFRKRSKVSGMDAGPCIQCFFFPITREKGAEDQSGTEPVAFGKE